MFSEHGFERLTKVGPARGSLSVAAAHAKRLVVRRCRSLLLLTVALGATAPSLAQVVTSVQLNSTTSGTLPFTMGLGFKKGDIPAVPVLDVATSQVVVKSRWPDNSVRHAIASGRVAMTAGIPKTLNVSAAGSAPPGANLTAADIQNANPSASVQLGSIGTVTLASLLGTPFRTWISGPEMVEAHYRGTVGSDPTLVVWFHVRLYQGGRVWIRAYAENGYLDVATSDKTYVPTVTIGGATVFNNGGASLTHYAHTRWSADAWIGGDPQVTPKHDTTYLRNAKLVPNYMQVTPSSATLNGLYQNYVPMQNGNWTVHMGDTGYQPQTGLLNLWDALYITSGADSRAFNSVLANAEALNSYPIVWTDSVTKLPPIPSNRPTWTLSGPSGGGGTVVGAGTLQWDIAHHGSGGFLAYMITGDYYYLQTMEDQVSVVYFIDSSVHGSGTSRVLQGQTRGAAWSQRSIGQLVSIGPSSDPVIDDYRTLLANLAAHWNNVRQTPGMNPLGYLFEYDLAAYGQGLTAPWQHHYWIQTYGAISDMEPLVDMTAWNAVRDHYYKAAVGILGPSGTNEFCFTKASNYNIKISNSSSTDPKTWYTSWGQVYQNTFGVANTSCGNTLEGESAGIPALAYGYWGRLLPAIAYAVEDGAPGAAGAWNRLTGATNWNVFMNSGFDAVPNWGIMPRTGASTVRPNAPTGLSAQ